MINTWIEQARAVTAQQQRRGHNQVMITGLATWPLMVAMGDCVRLSDRQMKETVTYHGCQQWTDLWAQTLRDCGRKTSDGRLRRATGESS